MADPAKALKESVKRLKEMQRAAKDAAKKAEALGYANGLWGKDRTCT